MDILIILRRHIAAIAAVMVFANAAHASASLESAVKAAYLTKFGIFVDWPKNTFETPQSPIVLCVTGDDPFGPALDKVAEGQRIGPRTLIVRRLRMVTRDSGCDILYIAGSTDQSVNDALGAVSGTGVLTVTDSVPDAHDPGIVEFVVTENRVRFNIDADAAAQNGITISSHLLSLANAVRHKN